MHYLIRSLYTAISHDSPPLNRDHGVRLRSQVVGYQLSCVLAVSRLSEFALIATEGETFFDIEVEHACMGLVGWCCVQASAVGLSVCEWCVRVCDGE